MRIAPKYKASTQDEHNAWQEQGDVCSVHGQENAPAHPIVLVLKPLQQLPKDAKSLQQMHVSDKHMKTLCNAECKIRIAPCKAGSLADIQSSRSEP